MEWLKHEVVDALKLNDIRDLDTETFGYELEQAYEKGMFSLAGAEKSKSSAVENEDADADV